ncbi:MAG: hypothetical protein ACKOTB_14415 [Planctomycetia bacterium]
MAMWREFTVAAAVAVVCGGCATLSPGVDTATAGRESRMLASLKRQYTQAVEGIKDDLKALDSNDDGLDGFGPVAAREMRSMRADLAR